jgi:hypothetical protein
MGRENNGKVFEGGFEGCTVFLRLTLCGRIRNFVYSSGFIFYLKIK